MTKSISTIIIYILVEVTDMTDNEIGNLIRQIRYENSLSSREFGDKYNVSFQSVARWERAKEYIISESCYITIPVTIA